MLYRLLHDNITLIFRLLLLQSSEGPESEGEEISSEDSDNDEVSETRQIISLLIRNKFLMLFICPLYWFKKFKQGKRFVYWMAKPCFWAKLSNLFKTFHISLTSQSMWVSTEIAVLLILLHSVIWTLICKTITFYDWQGHVTWQSFAKGL